jgi:hypothetical protein
MVDRRWLQLVAPSPPPLVLVGRLEMRRPPSSWAVPTRGEPQCSPQKSYLAGQPGVVGTVSISNGVVSVATSANEPTILLSVIGISSVAGRGSARVNIVATGDSR